MPLVNLVRQKGNQRVQSSPAHGQIFKLAS